MTGSAPAAWATAPSEDVVTVVDDTCLELLDRLPDEPELFGLCWEPLEALRC